MGRFFGFTLILLFFGGSNFYIGRRLYRYLGFLFLHMNGIVFTLIYIFLALSMFLGFFPLPAGIKSLMRLIGAYWLGIFVYLLIFFILSDLIILPGAILKLIPADLLQRLRFFAGTTVIVLTALLVTYGLNNANKTKFVSYDLELQRSLSGEINIVFLADLHLGDVNSEKRLTQIVEGINSLKPDIVCITGDIFNDDYYSIRNPDAASALFSSIKAAHGVYASLGNHDGGRTLNEMMDFLKRSNVKLLNDEYVIIDERLILAGRLDSSPIGGYGELMRKDFTEVMSQAETMRLPLVVMDHNPANINEYGDEVDLILAGHTHRGQMFPGSLFTRALFTVDYGHYQKDAGSPHVIVTQGVSTWMMPMRIGTNNEIVKVTVR